MATYTIIGMDEYGNEIMRKVIVWEAVNWHFVNEMMAHENVSYLEIHPGHEEGTYEQA